LHVLLLLENLLYSASGLTWAVVPRPADVPITAATATIDVQRSAAGAVVVQHVETMGFSLVVRRMVDLP
jgi:hypothetical protein